LFSSSFPNRVDVGTWSVSDRKFGLVDALKPQSSGAGVEQ
jgi:hypothetical protein